jgi:hypothetical protein
VRPQVARVLTAHLANPAATEWLFQRLQYKNKPPCRMGPLHSARGSSEFQESQQGRNIRLCTDSRTALTDLLSSHMLE